MFVEFLKAIVKHWVAWSSGAIGVALWIVGFVAEKYNFVWFAKWSFWCGAASALIFSFYSVWEQEHAEVLQLRRRFLGLPKLRFGKRRFHVDSFQIRSIQTPETYSVIRLDVINQPDMNTADSYARKIRAGVTFYSEDGQILLEIDGRWSDSPQPSRHDHSVDPMAYVTADIAIGMTRTIDVVAKRFHEPDCFGINNSSFGYPHLQRPEYLLPRGRISCTVRLQGEHVDESFKCSFRSRGGPLSLAMYEGEALDDEGAVS